MTRVRFEASDRLLTADHKCSHTNHPIMRTSCESIGRCTCVLRAPKYGRTNGRRVYRWMERGAEKDGLSEGWAQEQLHGRTDGTKDG